MKQLTFFEKVEALKVGKTLVYEGRKQRYDDITKLFYYEYDISPLIESYTPYNISSDWQIEEPKEPVYMTRLEILEYILSDDFKGRVVSFDNGVWYSPSYFSFANENDNKNFKHAQLKNGEISDIRKFVSNPDKHNRELNWGGRGIIDAPKIT